MSPSGRLRGPAVVTNDRTKISPEMLEIARSLGTYALTDTMDFTELDIYVDGLPDNPLDAAEDLCRAWADLLSRALVDEVSEEEFTRWIRDGALIQQSLDPHLAGAAVRSMRELIAADAGGKVAVESLLAYRIHDAYQYLQEHRWALSSGAWAVAEAKAHFEVGPQAPEARRKSFCGVLLMAWASVNSGSDALAVIRDYG